MTLVRHIKIQLLSDITKSPEAGYSNYLNPRSNNQAAILIVNQGYARKRQEVLNLTDVIFAEKKCN
jgi:hypothetical protein